jgi:hypothetical protein
MDRTPDHRSIPLCQPDDDENLEQIVHGQAMRPALSTMAHLVRNHAPDIAAMDLFVVPTIGFDLLYVLVIVRLARRDLVWINVTSNPTAEWIARQITEAFPWNDAPLPDP